ncbi:hypothetical protein GCM10010252_54560 [Streptomyces aureoverticillatus]|nr:hypothetical protein GCM10010252_54560 [Streptomyces aureoverticillatus]
MDGEHQLIHDCVEQAVPAEEMGFDRVWELRDTGPHPILPRPAHAIAYVERRRDAGADEVMRLVQLGTVPQEACLETLRQWGEKVIPHFRPRVREAA